MKEILTWEDAKLFDYINEVECLYVPYMEDFQYRNSIKISNTSTEVANKIETPVFGYSEIVAIFKNRYNEGKLMKQKLYKEYMHNVGHLLKDLELDAEKFWCLFLFALDYCSSIFYQGVTIKATPLEQLQSLVDIISNADDESIILNVKVGKKKTTIESQLALHFLAEAIQNQLKQSDYADTLHIREQEDKTKLIADSPIIVYFAKILLSFFDTQDYIKQKRKKGANYSTKEMDLVSKLIYFAGISTNKCWTDIENETLKAFLKQYKNFKYPNNISSVYPEFVVY